MPLGDEFGGIAEVERSGEQVALSILALQVAEAVALHVQFDALGEVDIFNVFANPRSP